MNKCSRNLTKQYYAAFFGVARVGTGMHKCSESLTKQQYTAFFGVATVGIGMKKCSGSLNYWCCQGWKGNEQVRQKS